MRTETEGLTHNVTVPQIAAAPEGGASWSAIVAGAVAAAALSLILLALGTGLGLSSVSPWAYDGASAKTMGYATAAWLLLMSAFASGLGGYLAGRLRRKWTDVDVDESYFRDTAHGFLAWALATVLTAAVLTSAASSMVGAAAKTTAALGMAATGAAAAGASAAIDNADSSREYFVDMMFRGGKQGEAGADATNTRREVGGIVMNALSGEMSTGDRSYLTQLVASRTGLSMTDAEQRVTQTTNAAKLAVESAQAKARDAAEAARKATAYTALWVFVAFLVGAFSATLAATWGGKRRDSLSYRPAS